MPYYQRISAFATVLLLAVGCGPSTSGEGASASGSGSTGSASAESTSVADGSSSTSGGFDPGCFPAREHGEMIAVHPSGLVAYEGCAGDFFIEHHGDMVIDSVDGIGAIGDASTVQLGEDGILALGTGSCCDDNEVACLALPVHVYEFEIEDLLAAISDDFPEAEGQCFGIRVELRGFAGPRCEEPDPRCLPIPVCEGLQDQGCCNAPDYDPIASRIPVGADELSGGFCEHDGWCYLNGAGVLCNGIERPPAVGFDDCTDEIREAFCGCVAGQCRWFELG